VPPGETLARFFKVLDEEEAYPVLIHCHHGTGRAELYSSLYLIEYEGWSNADARARTRLVIAFADYRSSFADGEPKGGFLMNYKARKLGKESTCSSCRGRRIDSNRQSGMKD
jgi:protein tyrosine/serine phosphatase